MSKAWGHTVRPLTEQEINAQMNSGNNWYKYQIEHPRDNGFIPELQSCIHHERKCRISAKCQNHSTHMLKYRYITGRAGRVSYQEKPICEFHAVKYQHMAQAQSQSIENQGEKSLNEG